MKWRNASAQKEGEEMYIILFQLLSICEIDYFSYKYLICYDKISTDILSCKYPNRKYSSDFSHMLTHVPFRGRLTNAKLECEGRCADVSLPIHTSNLGISSHPRCLRRCNGLQGRGNRSPTTAIVCHDDRRRAAFYVPTTTTTTTTQDSRGFGLTAETQSPIPRFHGKKLP